MSNDYFQHDTPLTRFTLARANQTNQIFRAIEAGFDKLPDPVALTQGRHVYVQDTGAANAYLVNLASPPAGYTAGLSFMMRAANSNTGPSTINVNGLGVKQLRTLTGEPTPPGYIVAGTVMLMAYDGTTFRVVGGNALDPSEAAALAQAALYAIRGTYYGALAADPSLDPNGNPPTAGDWYFNTATENARIYDGTTWSDLGAAKLRTFTYTAAGGETSLSGNDDDGNALAYTPGFLQVFHNGVLLTPGADYTATDGSTITGLAALTGGDVVVVQAFTAFSLTDFEARLAGTDAGEGASLVGLEQGGTAQDAVKWITPQMFGAVADGITDDTAAINAAIAAAEATAFEEVQIRWPAGHYRVSTIDLTSKNFIRFHADGVVQITGNDATKNFLIGSTNYNDGDPPASTKTGYVSMSGGPWLLAAGGQPYKYALRLEHFTNSQFHNVLVSGAWDDGLGGEKIAVYLQYSYYNSFHHCAFSTPGLPNDGEYSYCCFLGTNNNNINTFYNCVFSTGGAIPAQTARSVGIRISSNANKLINCDTPGHDIGIWLFGGRATSIDSHYTEGCTTSVYATNNALATQIVGGIFEVLTDGVAFDLGSSQNTAIISPYIAGLAGETNRTFIAMGDTCYGLEVFSPELFNIDSAYTGTYRGASTTNTSSVFQGRWVSFPPTQIPSIDPNTLDDYEEGTWTPTKGGTAFVSASGLYTKIGNAVILTFKVEFPVETNSDSASISGVPFSPGGGFSESHGLAVGYNTATVVVAGAIVGTTIGLRENGNGGGNLTYTQMSGAVLHGTIAYTIAGN